VTASFTFDWVRVGTSATLVIQPFTLAVEVAGLGAQNVVASPQSGVAAFMVTSTGPGGGVPTCEHPLTGVQGEIAGTVPLVQASG
jgi:hypothetical protein